MQVNGSRLLVAEAEMQAGELKPSHVNRVGGTVRRMVDDGTKTDGNGDAAENRLLPLRSTGIPYLTHVVGVEIEAAVWN